MSSKPPPSSSSPSLTTTPRRRGPCPGPGQDDDDDSTSVMTARRQGTMGGEPSSLLQPCPPDEHKHQLSTLNEEEEEKKNKNYDKNEEDSRIILGNPYATTTAAIDLHDGVISVVDGNSEPSIPVPPPPRRTIPPFISNSATGIFPDGLSVITTSTTTTMTTTTNRPGAVRVGSIDTDNSIIDGGMSITTTTLPLPRTNTPPVLLEAWEVNDESMQSKAEVQHRPTTETIITTATTMDPLTMSPAEVQRLKQWLWFFKWGFLFLVIIIGTVLGVFLSGNSSSSSTTTSQPTSSIQPTSSPSSSFQPTSSPSFSPTLAPEFETVVSELVNIVTSSDLNDSNSISYRAVNWLATNIDSNPDISIKEQYAIIVIYLSTGGKNWDNRENWTSITVSMCAWKGITDCLADTDSNTVTITNLDLKQNNLVGIIPSTVGLLTGLTSLNLAVNDLTGRIPTQIGQLTSLSFVTFYNNVLTGTIPTHIGQLTMLEWLYLSNNALTGTIPTQVGQLANVKDLWLYNNDLTGTIPTQIGLLTNLGVLWLHNNDLTGTIPTHMGQLTKLTRLDFVGNVGLTGDINSIFCDGMEYLGSYTDPSFTVWIYSTQDLNCNCCTILD